jgi:hypothetical protein
MAKGDGSSIAKSTRQERSGYDPHDFDRWVDGPQLGRDVPWKDGGRGFPVMDVQVRVQGYGSLGLRRETKCVNCGTWLSYEMCNGCQSLLRLTGRNDQGCKCFQDSLYIYGRCEDHRMFEAGPFGPRSS